MSLPQMEATMVASSSIERESDMLLWLLLAIAYLLALVFLGVATLRRGHFVLFFVGIVFPIVWVFGALMRPTAAARAV